jgi:hypothetical protein
VFQVARATGALPTIIPCLAKLRVPCSRHAASSFVWLFLPSSVLSLGACRYVQGRVDRCFVNRTLVVTCLLLFFLCLQPALVRTSLYASRLGGALAKDLRSYSAPFSFLSYLFTCLDAAKQYNKSVPITLISTNHHIHLSQPGHTSILTARQPWRAGLLPCTISTSFKSVVSSLSSTTIFIKSTRCLTNGMVEHPLKEIRVNHNVHTTNHPREAVEMRDLVRLILLSILLRNCNPADHFDRIRSLSCWVAQSQLQTEMHLTLEPFPSTVRIQALLFTNTLTQTP